jgi:hypothetical protein
MMSQEHFEAEVRRIEEEHARRREGADAYRDQEMARLFETCDWSQERIARAVGQSQRWVSYRLTFGRFLSFSTACSNHKAPDMSSLTEGRFRAAYAKTKGKEKERFADVLRSIDTDSHPPGYRRQVDKPGVRAAVREVLSDGRWKTIRELQAQVTARIPDLPPSCVSAAVRELQRVPPRGFFMESKHAGRLHQYRVCKGVPVPAGEDLVKEVTRLRDGVGPIIEELKQWGRAHEFQMSPGAIRRIASQLEKLFGRLLEPAGR